ncbi:MAG TPA: SRPBCC domain-containing protein, partial [Thermoanaerobaculia bacterium]
LGEEVAKFDLEPFTISRWFDAPRELIFRVWTDEKHLAKWFGPKGSEVTHSKNDFRPGGTYHYCMRYGSGDMWGRWVYREITPPSRLVYVSSFSDKDRTLQPAPFAEEWPREMLATVTFEERDGGTNVTVHWLPINAGAAEWETFDNGRASMTGGWTGTFDKLDSYLETL